jgi:hypothetical protein
MNSNTTTMRPEATKHRLGSDRFGALSRASESPTSANLRNRLLQETLDGQPGELLANLLRLAAVEAEAQAWLTSFPLLLFPTLFEEKARDAQNYVARQQRLRPR